MNIYKIFLPSPFRCHDLQEAKDSIDEEDPGLQAPHGATSQRHQKEFLPLFKNHVSMILYMFIIYNL